MPSLSDALRQELERLLGPLAVAAGSADRWTLILALVGHGEDTIRDAGLRSALDHLGALADLPDSDLESWDGIEALLTSSATAMDALHDLGKAGGDPALRARLAQLGPDLAAQLTAIYLRRYHPQLFGTGAALTLIDPGRPRPPVVTGNTRTRTAWTSDELHLERFGPLRRHDRGRGAAGVAGARRRGAAGAGGAERPAGLDRATSRRAPTLKSRSSLRSGPRPVRRAGRRPARRPRPARPALRFARRPRRQRRSPG
jgi:hypothetical protein